MLCPWVFPSSPPWPQKLLGITEFSSSHCSALQQGKEPRTFSTQGKGNRLEIFTALKSQWARWPRRALAAGLRASLKVGLWFTSCLLLPSTLPPLPIPQSRHLHHRDAKAGYVNCPQLQRCSTSVVNSVLTSEDRSFRRLQSRTHIVNHAGLRDSLFSVSPPIGL